LLSSSYEYPGRYTQWTIGFCDPPVCLEAWGKKFQVNALNCRGVPFLLAIHEAIQGNDALAEVKLVGSDRIEGTVKEAAGFFAEEDRSKQPSIFSVIRALVNLFSSDEDAHLGLYGAFGYDLAFQFEQ
ncbi:trpE(G), partial [Symbiodinium sp. CCMP2456]